MLRALDRLPPILIPLIPAEAVDRLRQSLKQHPSPMPKQSGNGNYLA